MPIRSRHASIRDEPRLTTEWFFGVKQKSVKMINCPNRAVPLRSDSGFGLCASRRPFFTRVDLPYPHWQSETDAMPVLREKNEVEFRIGAG